MGMFDSIQCSYPLPLPLEVVDIFPDVYDQEFQTKDLENFLDTYIINEDGEKEDITVYPTQECAINNLNTMLTKELAFKQLPQKALDEMAKKGLSPKKQPIEILLFIIVPCDVSVVVAVNNINNMIDMSDLCNHIDGEICDDNMAVKYTDSSLKESDNINRNIFNYLKQIGIYSDTAEEDMVFDF